MARSDAKLRLLQFYLSARAQVVIEFSLHNEPVGALTRRSERIELKQRALDARNAARKFLLDHKRLRPLYGIPSTKEHRGKARLSS
jgi:hypothetical protein